MNSLCALLIVAALAPAFAVDEPPPLSFSWVKLSAEGELKTGKVLIEAGQPEVLKISHAGPDPLQTTLLTITQPYIKSNFYRIEGEVRYDDVAGDGFLEMWSHFPEQGAYFSRTLGEVGPMGKLRGSSDWRPFVLPFDGTGAKSAPYKLVFNLHLPGKGTVYLRNVKFIHHSSVVILRNAPGAWWSDRTAGWIGGLGGAAVGILGGALEWCASRRRARNFVLLTTKTLVALGIGAMLLGLVALASWQPYGVWYPLLLGGILCAGIFPFRLRRYQAQFRELELRRIAAFDAA
jgi:hypothetical protein